MFEDDIKSIDTTTLVQYHRDMALEIEASRSAGDQTLDGVINFALVTPDAISALSNASEEMGTRGYASTGDLFIGLLRLPRGDDQLSLFFSDKLAGIQETQVSAARDILHRWDASVQEGTSQANIIDRDAMQTVVEAQALARRMGSRVNPVHLMISILNSPEQSGAALFSELQPEDAWKNDPVDNVLFNKDASVEAKREVIGTLFGFDPSVLDPDIPVALIIGGSALTDPTVHSEGPVDVFKAAQDTYSTVRAMCTERKITSGRLAADSELSVQTIDAILTGTEKKPRDETVKKLAKGLGVPVTDIMPDFYRIYAKDVQRVIT
ncbi:MAG: helix-turn-helix transcriptional regulator [bacterium]|nr:helix-turn-helix transcriptional regulator [bacterium]